MLKVANSVISASRITGVLPVVNGGTGVTTSTGTGNTVLSATPTLSGDVNLSTGNLVIGTAGKGIDFSADPSAAGMTSELLADYEEGTWTPVVTPGTAGAITSYTATGVYTKVGRQVTVNFKITMINAGTGTGATIITLPFTQGNYANGSAGAGREDAATGSALQLYGYPNQAFIYISLFNNNPTVVTGFVLQGAYTYFV